MDLTKDMEKDMKMDGMIEKTLMMNIVGIKQEKENERRNQRNC